MKVLVDTSVWSELLRRKNGGSRHIIQMLVSLIRDKKVVLIGPVRQELLSGIRDPKDYDVLRDRIDAFPNENPETEDFERAAQVSNGCGAKGIQGSAFDMLICGMALRHGWEIFTLDKDFNHYAKVVPIRLLHV